MPTAGRLIGAFAFAIVAAYLAYVTTPLFEEGRRPSFWYPLCICVGLWAGWAIVGRRSGHGYSASVGLSMTGIAALAFWILFIYSSYDMIGKSMRKAYDGPVEAVVNVFELLAKYGLQFMTLDVITALVVGGFIAGMFTEFFARRYP